jgi:8-oxo-dGTP pyrophosphatase MutT (NUDIX family)
MTTDRLFCRFNRGKSTTTGKVDESPMSLKEIPLGGLCLSSFLIVRDPSGRVLMGKIDPRAPWDHLGALDPNRIELHSKGWMLPASHLMVHESPHAAAHRIAEEQLELPGLVISEPKVVSEVYPPKYFPDQNEHWDLEFISFSIVQPSETPTRSRAFRELQWIDTKNMQRSEIARSHEDILSSVGIELPT